LLLFCLTFSSHRCEVLQGPGSNARIIPYSDRISPDDLPLEHRTGDALLLPDVFSVSRNVTSQLGVDLFFSLFFVFLNDQYEESDSLYTIFAPAGLATAEATRWLRTEEKLTEELLMSHIVMGEHLRPELVISGDVVRTTLGGLDVSFQIDEKGEILVNDVKIVAWKTEGKALIIALEDYLFKQEVQQEVGIDDFEYYEMDEDAFKTETDGDFTPIEWELETEETESSSNEDRAELIPTPRNTKKNCKKVENKSGLSIFKSITVCTEKVEVTSMAEEEDLEPSMRKLDPSLPLLEEIEKELSFIRGGPGLTYLLSYANKTGLQHLLSVNKTYTVLAPVDEAFQSWHPIDWGFNPFDVTSFLNNTLANHVVEGSEDIEPGSDTTILTTIGGRIVKITFKGENTYANGVQVKGKMQLQGGRGRVLFLDQVLWVDHDVVEDLNNEFSFLETGPPINSPWNNSQFLSHSLAILEKLPNTSQTGLYMNMTNTLGNFAPGRDGYTFFVPTDEAFSQLCPFSSVNTIENSSEKQRLDLLLGHLVVGRMVMSDYNDTSDVTTMSGRNISLIISPAGQFVVSDGSVGGPAVIIGDPVYVYNLGTLIVIDRVLFGEETGLPCGEIQERIRDTQTEIITTLEISSNMDESNETLTSSQETFTETSFVITDINSDMSDNTTGVDDLILFPEIDENSTKVSETTTTEEVVFPSDENSTVIDDYDFSTEPDPSSVVFQVKNLLKNEISQEDEAEKDKVIIPRQRRIVYINNQRVEIEDEELL